MIDKVSFYEDLFDFFYDEGMISYSDIIDESMNLSSDLGIDSLDKARLSLYIEKTYGVVIDERKMDKIQTIKELFECVSNLSKKLI